MAGTLAHFLVMKKYFETKENKTIHFNNQDPNIATAFLGATGPDIFYVAGKNKNISDYHHYKNSGVFLKNLYESDTSSELELKGTELKGTGYF